MSGRSSAYGDAASESQTIGPRSETSSVGVPSSSVLPECDPEGDAEGDEGDYDQGVKLHALRLVMLERMLLYLPEIRNVGGVGAIPFMQVCFIACIYKHRYSILYKNDH